MGFSTGLYSSISGLRNAQTNLAITGQNVSNSTVPGYTRQQLIQTTSPYQTTGSSPVGSLKKQVGLGSDSAVVRQIRNKFFDEAYREQSSRGNFYATKYTTGEEINHILGELQSEYRIQQVIEDLWGTINDLVSDPSAIETRNNFIQSCVTFLDKAKNIGDNLYNYQMNLNQQVKQQVDKINEIVDGINTLNKKIFGIESDGTSRANDLRDERNNLIDELSNYVGIDVKEVSVCDGKSTRIDILVNGKELLVNNYQNKLGLQYMNGEYPFVEPVFTSSEEILDVNIKANKLYPNLESEDLEIMSNLTRGSLKSLLICRGDSIGNYTSADADVKNLLIPKLQKQLDSLTNAVVTMLNEAVMPSQGDLPFNLNGQQVATPIFVRKTGVAIGDAVDPNKFETLYTLQNLEINPDLLKGDGYNLLAFSASGAQNDTTILQKLSVDWKTPVASLGGVGIDSFYQKIVTDFAIEINAAQENFNSQATMVESIDNRRMSISAVSLDEELSDMLRFQYAYNASAKIINVIDKMIEKVVNG